MSLADIILGRPLATTEEHKEELTVVTGVPVLGLDALASTGYGPEAALIVLLPAGLAGLRQFPIIMIAIVLKLASLYLSYQQTAAAYPNGGGAYVVAKENLGIRAGLWAAISLLIDYLLNVAVGIAAGVGAVVSAIPALHPYTLPLCLVVLATLTIINLRGVRESGLVFIVPVFAFIACLGVVMALGLIRIWFGDGPDPVVPPPPIPEATQNVTTWLLLTSFANGCTAMTGIEAVSNGVPLFREPKVRNALRTLTVIAATLGLFLLGLAYLCPAYRIVAMDERQPGYQNILSQLVAAVTGKGAFYYLALASIFVVLTYSAQTSFADFPRVCRLLAEDRFLPSAFAKRGRRLVFTHGIVVLTLLSGLLLVVFGGITDSLIPLFAVGAFSAFLFSQVGMVVHWLRQRSSSVRVNLAYNALGAATTSVALVIIVVAKFLEGAWMTIVAAPMAALLLQKVQRHYEKVDREIERPIQFKPQQLQPPAVIVPIDGVNRVTEQALEAAVLLSDDVTALHVSIENDDKERLQDLWTKYVDRPARAVNISPPRLVIVDSPYRRVYEPILSFVNKTKSEKPGRLIAVLIPELAQPKWYETLLHNVYGAGLKTMLYLKCGDRTMVIYVPWYLREHS
jgi:amino acid transporter